MQVKAEELAKFILVTYRDVPISPMKLQKLAYYAKVWSVVANKKIIDADFERWDFGPVNRHIYFKYKQYSKMDIPAPDEAVSFGAEKEDFLKFVLQNYIDKSAVSLSIQTHKEKPWADTAPNEIITDEVIWDYFSKQNFAKNFDREDYKGEPFYVLKTNSWHSFTMDMDSQESSHYETYPSYEEFVERTQRAKTKFDKVLKEHLRTHIN